MHLISLNEDQNVNRIIRRVAPLSKEAKNVLMSSSNGEESGTIFLGIGVMRLDRQLLFVQQSDVTVRGTLAFLGW
jgi:hypothetical protein